MTTIEVTLLTPNPGAGSTERVRIEVRPAQRPGGSDADAAGKLALVETSETRPVYELMPPNPHTNAP